MTTRIEFVPEPFTTEWNEAWAPRIVGDRRLPAYDAAELGLSPEDAACAERVWVRGVEPGDLSDEIPCVSGYAGPSCGDCGCFVMCSSRDPRRAQPVWWRG